MNIMDRIQHLDTLIIEQTKPPVTAQLRNQLALVAQEMEAYLEDAKSSADAKKKAAELRKIIQNMKAEKKTMRFGRDANGFWNPLGI